MDYKKIGAGVAMFAVVLLAGIISVSAFGGEGFRGNHERWNHGEINKENHEKGLKMNSEKKAQITEVIESGDYAAWVELMGDKGKLYETITEENFDQFREMHQLKMDGNYEEAKVIAQELGIGNMNGRFMKKGYHGFKK